ncbi:MAG: ribonuclease R [Ignavibacteriae bacterium]|nr:ribonuclease R [Ignavibacteriota bacterium]
MNYTLDELKSRVLDFLEKHRNEDFKPNELFRRLSLKDSNKIYPLLLEALTQLFDEKLITRQRRKRYSFVRSQVSHQTSGTLFMTKQGHGIVEVELPEKASVIIQQRYLSTALHGDKVSVEIFARPTSKTLKQHPAETLEGEIVEVLERSNFPVVGTFEKSKNFFFVVPDDRRIQRDIYIPKGGTLGARPNQKVVALIDNWTSEHLNPEGHIIEVLGNSGEVRAEMASVARQFKLPLSFQNDVSKEVEAIPDAIPKSEIKKRLDLRKLLCFTIDPVDAKDFDDAVSLELLPDGNFKLGVHIADVSHYVQEKTKLDNEAYKRGTSVYLADGVVPMLPEKLSNNLCSLRPNEDRLTYSAFMTVTPRGSVKDYQIAKSVIHSKRRFTYEEVQSIIETKKGDYAELVLQMERLSKILLKKRLREGSIDFESVETKFRFDEHGKPLEIVKKVRLDAHRLVEEFMLLANQTVAKHIGTSKKEENIKPFVFRIHDAPDPEKLENLSSFVEHLGYKFNKSGVTAKALQQLLHDVKGKEEETVINNVAIRAMAKAVYSEKNIGHFGLGFKHYSHFTSPIRRYPDLLVHRLLFEYEHKMSHARREHFIKNLPDMCEHSSMMERNAMEAERASVKVMQVEYMKRHLGDEFHGIISGVTNFGMFIELTDTLVEGLIRLRDLEDDYYIFDEKKYSLIGRRTKKRYRLGDKVSVKVVRVDPEKGEIDFLLVD